MDAVCDIAMYEIIKISSDLFRANSVGTGQASKKRSAAAKRSLGDDVAMADASDAKASKSS